MFAHVLAAPAIAGSGLAKLQGVATTPAGQFGCSATRQKGQRRGGRSGAKKIVAPELRAGARNVYIDLVRFLNGVQAKTAGSFG